MSHRLFIKIALPLILIPALIVLFLPMDTMSIYADIIEPVSLLAGSALALWVSFIYRKELRVSFTFLSVFLLFYALAIVFFLSYHPIAVPTLETRLDAADITSIISAVQFVNYAILLFFCIYLLRAISITRLNRAGWIAFGVTVAVCLLLALYPVKDLFGADDLPFADLITIIIRVLDALLIIALVPVIWLYIQYLRSQQRQSLTFTVIIFGIICATVFDFLFQFIITLFPGLLSADSPLHYAIPEAIFIAGYLIIAIGLYAHRKQDEWGFEMIDRLLPDEGKSEGER